MSKEYTNKQIAQCVPAAYRWALVNSEIVKLLLKKNNYFTQEKYDITLLVDSEKQVFGQSIVSTAYIRR